MRKFYLILGTFTVVFGTLALALTALQAFGY